jgi:hypothetical protein
MLLGIFLLLFLSFFTYMAMLSYAARRKLRDAFDIRQVMAKSMNSGYFLGFLFLFAYTLGLSLIGAVASVSGGVILGRVIAYFVSIITLVTISDAMGQAYA